VKAELAAHNDARLARKDTPVLTHDVKASAKIQEMLNDKAKKYSEATADKFVQLQTAAGGKFSTCIQSVFLGAYTSGGATATKAWIAGGPALITDAAVVPASKTAAEKRLAYAFIEVVAKAGVRVGFGQKGQAFVAWYCADDAPKKPAVATEGTDFHKTENCLKDATGKYNTCFNDASLKEANLLRV
jgi:hypothetical protein